eukprot:TRINITY_DN56615_c0_g1_i1.p1 TRINITY_DN56615_c0_g1~~TRINITY_DN56615_c0_g1_i1.p1  ORF type:complete len:465 (-),score=82.56 TRINITY_DN56615_c0_g1_i1:16-1374(-)
MARDATREGDDQRELSTDEENAAADRKLAESRRRREALAEALREQEAKRVRTETGGRAPDAAPTPAGFSAAGKQGGLAAEGQTREATPTPVVGWDDEDGYYRPKTGELLEKRYLVVDPASVRGVFANVIKARDQAHPEKALVAVKMMRASAMMSKTAEREIEILELLKRIDPTNQSNIVKLTDTFDYRKHTCLVFECMHDDLRGALKKYTQNKGMTLSAVKSFTQQLLVGLNHMHRCNILHGDVKPDNILIDEKLKLVRFCDLGSAVQTKDVAVNLYLASRFYRPPEAILGLEYGYSADTWSLGCTLFELFTGKVLFKSTSNNDHLKVVMELRGKVTRSMVKRAAVYVDFKGNKMAEWKKHFTDELDFKHVVLDPHTKQETTKIITNLKVKRSIKDLVMERVGTAKRQSTALQDQQNVKKAVQFADLLELMLPLDPEKRLRLEDALGHEFLK